MLTFHPPPPPFQELVAALHSLILIHEKQFQIAALRISGGDNLGSANLSTSVTPCGWIHVSIEPPEIEPPEIETSLNLPNGHSETQALTPRASYESSSSSSVESEERFLDPLPKKSLNSQSFGPTSSVTSNAGSSRNMYSHVWKGVVFLASDPFQEVAELAQYVILNVHDKVRVFFSCEGLATGTNASHFKKSFSPYQLRQKSLAKSIGATLTSSYSPTSPLKQLGVGKSATLAAAGIRGLRYICRRSLT